MKTVVKIGLACVVLMLLMSRFADMPFLAGLLSGAGACLLLFGLMPQKTADTINNFKKAILSSGIVADFRAIFKRK